MASNMPGIGDFFTNELIMPARVANPWQQLNFEAYLNQLDNLELDI